MKSHVRIILIIAISIAVPFLAIRQRWSAVTAFARQLQGEPEVAAVELGRTPSPSHNAHAANAPATVEPAPPVSQDWQTTMEQVLVSSSEPSVASQKLLAALPSLPDSGKVEVVQHLTNLVSDDDYAPLSQMLSNPETPEGVQELLMADVLNRRNGVKLPALLEVARTPNHARAIEAKAFLQPYLQGDFSDDWNKCSAKLNQWLKEHPDS